MTTHFDVAEMLKEARSEAGLSQDTLAQRAGVARTTVAHMENLSKGDMSAPALLRLLEAAGYDLKLVKWGTCARSRTSWLSSAKVAPHDAQVCSTTALSPRPAPSLTQTAVEQAAFCRQMIGRTNRPAHRSNCEHHRLAKRSRWRTT